MIKPNSDSGFMTDEIIHVDGSTSEWKSPYSETTAMPNLIYQVVHYGHSANDIFIEFLEKVTGTFGMSITECKYRIDEWISRLKTSDISVMVISETEETVNIFIAFKNHWYHFEFYTRQYNRAMFIPSVETGFLPNALAADMIEQMLLLSDEKKKINEFLK